jgi:hypothetical protein
LIGAIFFPVIFFVTSIWLDLHEKWQTTNRHVAKQQNAAFLVAQRCYAPSFDVSVNAALLLCVNAALLGCQLHPAPALAKSKNGF